MRLSGRGVRCVRGGREVFSGLDFEASSGEALAITGANGSGKTSLLRMIAGLLAIADGSIGLEGGETELTLPEQAHYLGHRDALKPALSVIENLAFWRDFLGGEPPDARTASGEPVRWSGSTMRSTCRPRICRPASGGGSRSPGCSRSGARSGCWTSRPMRSTPPGKACSPG